jgi:hypothetical protein
LDIEFPDDDFFEEVDTLLKEEMILRELQMYLMGGNSDIYMRLFKHFDTEITEKIQTLFNKILSTLGIQPSFQSL